MKHAFPAAIALTGLVNFAPLAGVLSTRMLTQLYGLDFVGPDLEILMRHRAVLFGLVGGFMLYSVSRPPLRRPAAVMGLVSKVSFILLAVLVGDYNAPLHRIVMIDAIAAVALAVAWALDARLSTSPGGHP